MRRDSVVKRIVKLEKAANRPDLVAWVEVITGRPGFILRFQSGRREHMDELPRAAQACKCYNEDSSPDLWVGTAPRGLVQA